MNIWEADKLIIFIAFVIPSFISLKVYDLLCPGSPKDSSKQVVDAVAYSCINDSVYLELTEKVKYLDNIICYVYILG